ncbi:MAG: formate dehydrogenase accessory protein FdhE [Nitrospira sp.]|nr:formate dehydrogenase accessory protein FdhE [Nitrospira sp.]
MTEATIRVMSPEEIVAGGAAQTPFIVWPRRETVFGDRAVRARQLAAGHPMRDFLVFVADIAQQQHELLQAFAPVPLPDAAQLQQAAEAGMPPLPATRWPRDPAWRAALRSLVAALRTCTADGSAAARTLAALAASSDEQIELQADRLLNGVMTGLDLGAAPLIAAALQVYWTHLVLEVQRAHGDAGPAPFGRGGDAGTCPCCGTQPTASITRIGAGVSGQRYLHCALCSTQWHMVRIQCAHCGSGEHIAYQALEPLAGAEIRATGAARGAIQAETCGDCGHYLKIVHMTKDPQVDPVADDLASISLDLLVAETGRRRHGLNLMLLFGDSPTPDGGGP